MRTLASLDAPISALVVSPDGSMVITASGEQVGFLDLASGDQRVTALGDGVRRLAWGPDGLLAGTSSGEVWAVGARPERQPERLIEAIDEEISGIAVAHDGTIAVCGGEPFAVATFGRYGNEEWRAEPYKWPYCVRLSADGKQLVVGTWDGNLFVLDTGDLPDDLGQLETEYAGGPIFDAQFLPDGNVLVAGARFVRVWDHAAGAYAQSRELDAEALAIAVAPDGSCAAAATNDQRLRLFRLPDLEDIGQLAMGSGDAGPRSYFPDYAEFCNVKGPATIRTLAFHPDGARLFASTEDNRLLEVARSDLRGVAPARKAAGTPPPAAREAPIAHALTAPDAAPAQREKPTSKRAKPAAQQAATSKPAARKAAMNKPAAHKAATKQRAAKPAAQNAATNKPAAQGATRKRAAQPAAQKAATGKAASRRAARPAAPRPTGKQAIAKPTARAAAKPAVRGPASKKSVRAAGTLSAARTTPPRAAAGRRTRR